MNYYDHYLNFLWVVCHNYVDWCDTKTNILLYKHFVPTNVARVATDFAMENMALQLQMAI